MISKCFVMKKSLGLYVAYSFFSTLCYQIKHEVSIWLPREPVTTKISKNVMITIHSGYQIKYDIIWIYATLSSSRISSFDMFQYPGLVAFIFVVNIQVLWLDDGVCLR